MIWTTTSLPPPPTVELEVFEAASGGLHSAARGMSTSAGTCRPRCSTTPFASPACPCTPSSYAGSPALKSETFRKFTPGLVVMGNQTPVISVIKYFTIVIHDLRVMSLENCPYYESWVVIYIGKFSMIGHSDQRYKSVLVEILKT